MTIKELSVFFGKSDKTIRRAITKNKIVLEHGKLKVFSKQEVEILAKTLYKTFPLSIKESIDLTFNTPMTNDHSIDKTNVQSEIMSKLINVLENVNNTLLTMNTRIEKLENKTPDIKQLPIQPKLSVGEYAKKHNITSFNLTGLLQLAGRIATKMSKDYNRAIQYKTIPLTGFSEGLYDEDLLSTAFIIAEKNQKVLNKPSLFEE